MGESANSTPLLKVDGRKTRNSREATLTERVRLEVLEEIVQGKLPAGSMLNLGILAQRLGVSRTPVREGLALLEHQGLVHAIPYKGYLVGHIEPQDVHDVMLLRRVLEGPAAALATNLMSDDVIDALMHASPPPSNSHMTLEYDANTRNFHRTIVEEARSARLLSAFDTTYNDVRRLQYTGMGTPRPQLIHREHQVIATAMRDRDPVEARNLMEDHIDQVLSRMLEDWVGRSPSDRATGLRSSSF